jgi:tricorn protease
MRRSIVVILWVLFATTVAAAPAGYYRQPAIHGDTVIFVSEGDLWKVDVGGGVAGRLTTHLGEELHPAISPDGAVLGFTAVTEGGREVYTMPMEGGLPERRTWDGGGATVTGWTPDGRLVYRTRKFSTVPNAQLVLLDLVSGARDRVPLAQAADGSWDRAGGPLVFTRLPAQGSHTKRYKGGTAQKIWSLAPDADEAVPLTADYDGTSKEPMWWDERVYFTTDRDGTMNLWSMAPDGTDLQQHTRHDGWDVKDADLHDGRIVYQLGADLRILDIASGADREIPIELASDFDQMRERWVAKPVDYLTSAHLSPDGRRLAMTARGQVFVAPVRQGRLVEATRKDGVRYRSARFMGDDGRIAVLSDQSGEVEWWTVPSDGIGEPRQITDDGKVLRFDGVPSPDGRWIASFDQDQELWLTEVATGESRKIDFSPLWGFGRPAWSPDSRWLAWSRPADNAVSQIWLFEIASGEKTAVTTDRFDSYSPTWSPDGDWLWFLSDRTFRSLVRSPWGPRQPEPFFDRSTKIYALALRPGLRFPFRPDDELMPDENGDDEKGKGKSTDGEEDDEEKAPVEVEIDLDGIRSRIHEVPVPPGNYGTLSVTDKALFWIDRKTTTPRTRNLVTLEIDNEEIEPKVLVEDVRLYELSGNGKKILVRKDDVFHVLPAKSGAPAKLEAKNRVDLSGWKFSLDPRDEWRQMFVESWRLERDYFYDPGMHGVDWDAMLAKYLPLVERVRSREELADLQAQMVSELSALHIFVWGGDRRKGLDDVAPAFLGAVLVRDEDAGGLRVEHVYRTDPDRPDELSPLARPGVDVREGDVIASIDGTPALAVPDPGVLLRNRAGRQVRLQILPSGGGDERSVIVNPITVAAEADLRYDEWEYTRRLRVEESGGGEIGYVHLRAMGGNNIAEWQRDFYPVFDRAGLIVDVRHNRGGNIDSWILEKLLRRAWMYWKPRVGDVTWNMQYAFRGHMVVLVNEWTASDGEAFAEGFRRLGLGKVIGTRTWGGEIWLTSSNVLVDRGIATAAEFGVFGPEGTWLIEGWGFEPDIVVDNLPRATFEGDDAQLEAAIRYLQDRIREDPRDVPDAPVYPDKSGP